MPNHYAKQQWKIFRSEVIELDGGLCRRCQRGLEHGKKLQVHHMHYSPGKMPWEYSYDACETLCQGCHAAEHGIIPPAVGWDYLGDEDLGDLSGTCDYCGTELRYVFHIVHAHWEPMGVGTDCCDKLTQTTMASELMGSINRYRSRKERFASSARWIQNKHISSIRQKNIKVEILALSNGFQIRMNGYSGKRTFPTDSDAKNAAFDVIENGDAEAYLSKKSKRP